MRILLVQDDEREIEALRHCFEREHHVHGSGLTVTRDGQSAIDHLQSADGHYRPHVVFLEVLVQAGLEVLRMIKGHPRMRLIPVVALTRSNDPDHVIESYELGANSYVVKPDDAEEMQRVCRALGRYWMLHNEPPSL